MIVVLTQYEANLYLEIYVSMTLKEHFDKNLEELSLMDSQNVDFGKIEHIMKSVVENEVL